jgi:hypothetical protein
MILRLLVTFCESQQYQLPDELRALNSNAITFVGAQAFSGLASLQYLCVSHCSSLNASRDLYNNSITMIEADTFSGLASLQHLYMSCWSLA